MSDYKIALLCNAYSTNSDCFGVPMGVLVETIYGTQSMRINLPGTNCMALGSFTPLPMNLLDSVTVHAKMRCVAPFQKQNKKTFHHAQVVPSRRSTCSLIHSIATRV